jgi:CubicO group peptidase (beta-lactamase class C family)
MSLRSLALASLITLTALTALTACGGGGGSADANTKPDANGGSSLQASADRGVGSGLAGIVLAHLTSADATVAVAGLRQVGASAKLAAGDAFMIGSTTKAMTAALAGRLVEQGRIAWTTTLAQALPELAAGMQPAYRAVTLEQLLAHRGGLLAFTSSTDLDRFQAALDGAVGPLPSTPAARERFFAAWLLAQQPPTGIKPGQDFAYSNAGYTLVALMLEVATGRPFAELFEQELARPLGMTVGWTSSNQAFTGRPVGHVGARGHLAVPALDNAEVAAWVDLLRPAGEGLTITPDSYATWLRWHLRALRGEATPLASGYLQRLRGLKANDYAVGWIGIDIDGRAAIAHDGVYRGFSSLVAIDAQGRSASFGFTNTQADDGNWVPAVLSQAVIGVERALPPQ